MKYTANGIQLNVLEQGSGPLTLVFLHYFGGSVREWQLVMGQLSDQYRCIAIDMRGHGDSDAPASGYSVEDMADDISDLLNLLDVQRYVLVGHSMSGKVALMLASRQPVGLQSLILVSPSPPPPEPISVSDRQDMLTTHGQPSAAEETFKKITNKPVSEGIKEQIVSDNLRTSETAWNAWLTWGSKEDISAQMSSVNAPVALIAGTADRAIKPDVQPEMTVPYLKTVSFDRIEAVGHLIPLEAPDILVDFIEKKIAGI